MDLTKLAEERIQEAIERGEFDNLEGAGKKIDLTEYFNTPSEYRAGYSLLKANRFVPGEVELMREIAMVRESLDSAQGREREVLLRSLAEKEISLAIIFERNHRGARRK
ncbi:MAG: DUF1992 domain-containing protein [Acidobacteria bacterium]|nr:MAG: DUF1992 domain-containing protein [Acidobacteriota bacterium]REK04206.1 MAG: DUF1992 domain-containing protein [Acidobacteriota bacterium]REK15368.1 MAG: DUF1992 domain-containing protein [Acidobacteriota bacterium]REK46458.1 MAG: DUF1992 domain-containing protein [Acidobacteriota bacterium]